MPFDPIFDAVLNAALLKLLGALLVSDEVAAPLWNSLAVDSGLVTMVFPLSIGPAARGGRELWFMLPISAGSVAIQSTLVDYHFGRLDKAAVAVAVVEVVRFVAITGVTVDAPTDAIVEAAEVVAVAGFVEAVAVVDFDRSLVDSCRLLDCYPYLIDQTKHHLPFADYLARYYPKNFAATVVADAAVGSVVAIVVATAVAHRLVLKGLVETEDSLHKGLRHFAHSDLPMLNCLIR